MASTLAVAVNLALNVFIASLLEPGSPAAPRENRDPWRSDKDGEVKCG
jgi:hypothetical protein